MAHLFETLLLVVSNPQTKAKVGQPRKIRIKGETSH
jgi:hypothetical protein